jgi:hypothetical protein
MESGISGHIHDSATAEVCNPAAVNLASGSHFATVRYRPISECRQTDAGFESDVHSSLDFQPLQSTRSLGLTPVWERFSISCKQERRFMAGT